MAESTPAAAERLTLAAIIDAAAEIVARDGFDGLSMRKLAAEIGVAPTGIYWHVGSRDDLLNAVLDVMVADLPPIIARGAVPRARLYGSSGLAAGGANAGTPILTVDDAVPDEVRARIGAFADINAVRTARLGV